MPRVAFGKKRKRKRKRMQTDVIMSGIGSLSYRLAGY